jgi:hypothetical protein
MVTRRTATKKAAPPPEVDEIEDLEIDDLDDVEVDEEEEAPKPAPKRRAPAARKPAARKKAPEPEPELEDDDVDDGADEESEPAPAPKKRGRPAKAPGGEKPKAAPKRTEIEFGTQWLVEYVNGACGTSYKSYDLRVLLRKMAKSDELDREVGADRSRYSFTGEGDPVVRAVVKKVKSGAVENEKKAALDNLKERTAVKKAAADGNVTPIKKRGRPAKPKPVVDEEDLDDDDVEDLD